MNTGFFFFETQLFVIKQKSLVMLVETERKDPSLQKFRKASISFVQDDILILLVFKQ